MGRSTTLVRLLRSTTLLRKTTLLRLLRSTINWNNETKGDIFESILGCQYLVSHGFLKKPMTSLERHIGTAAALLTTRTLLRLFRSTSLLRTTTLLKLLRSTSLPRTTTLLRL